MKHSFVALFIILLLYGKLHAQISVGPLVGINNTRYKYLFNKNFYNPDRNDIVADYRLGIIADIPLDKNNLHLQPGLLFSRNSERSFSYYNHNNHIVFNINAIEVPVSIVIKGDKNRKRKWSIGFGSLLFIHVNGSRRINYYEAGKLIRKEKSALKIGADTVNAYGRAGFGLRAETGYEFKGGCSLKLFYQNEFTNLIHNPFPGDSKVTRINYGVNFAYLIPRRKAKKDESKPQPQSQPSRYNQPRRPSMRAPQP